MDVLVNVSKKIELPSLNNNFFEILKEKRKRSFGSQLCSDIRTYNEIRRIRQGETSHQMNKFPINN